MISNTLAIAKNRLKLERMISNGEDYCKILKQSQKLDRFINVAMREKINRKQFNKK